MGWGLLLKYKCSYQNETENIGLTTFWFSIRGIQGEHWNVGAASSLLIARGGLRVGTEVVKVCGPGGWDGRRRSLDPAPRPDCGRS